MSDTPLTLEEIRVMAEGIGLNELSDKQLEQLRQVTNIKRTQSSSALFASLGPADEPANVFGLTASEEGKQS